MFSFSFNFGLSVATSAILGFVPYLLRPRFDAC
jgi:hypothetical protein